MGSFWVLMLLGLAIGYVVAYTRKGTVTMRLGGRVHEIRTAADPGTAAERIRQLEAPYVVDAVGDGVVVLSSPVTFFSFGFFYPVHIQADGTGSVIRVGVHSKVFQIGPIPARAHTVCVEAIEKALSIPTARVA